MTERTLRISARMAEEIQQWASDELSQWPRDTAYAADLENLLSQLTAATPTPDAGVDKIPHDWAASPYGHGEWACRYCKATNREIAVIGDPNHCPDRAKKSEEPLKGSDA